MVTAEAHYTAIQNIAERKSSMQEEVKDVVEKKKWIFVEALEILIWAKIPPYGDSVDMCAKVNM